MPNLFTVSLIVSLVLYTLMVIGVWTSLQEEMEEPQDYSIGLIHVVVSYVVTYTPVALVVIWRAYYFGLLLAVLWIIIFSMADYQEVKDQNLREEYPNWVVNFSMGAALIIYTIIQSPFFVLWYAHFYGWY